MGFVSDEEKIKQSNSITELESIITKAIKKVGGSKENDLCRYIPMSSGGYMHHFTLRKMKNKQPDSLLTLIEKFIINKVPTTIPPKTRAARGSRKRKDQLNFTKSQLEKLLNMARLAGDKEMISILSPKKSFNALKRELIQNIKQEKISQELWNTYVETLTTLQNLSVHELINLNND